MEEDNGFGGSWDSFNVVDIDLSGEEATFSLTTTIMIEMLIKNAKQGEVDTTGFLKQSVKYAIVRRANGGRWTGISWTSVWWWSGRWLRSCRRSCGSTWTECTSARPRKSYFRRGWSTLWSTRTRDGLWRRGSSRSTSKVDPSSVYYAIYMLAYQAYYEQPTLVHAEAALEKRS